MKLPGWGDKHDEADKRVREWKTAADKNRQSGRSASKYDQLKGDAQTTRADARAAAEIEREKDRKKGVEKAAKIEEDKRKANRKAQHQRKKR